MNPNNINNFSIYYGILRKTGEHECLAIGGRGDTGKHRDMLIADQDKESICSKYCAIGLATDYGKGSKRSLKAPVKKTKSKKISEE